jgi:hypothetical protein
MVGGISLSLMLQGVARDAEMVLQFQIAPQQRRKEKP